MEIIDPGHPDFPPPDIIEAATKVAEWASRRAPGRGWALGPVADRTMADQLRAEVEEFRDAAIKSGEEFNALRTELHGERTRYELMKTAYEAELGTARQRIRELVQQEAHWKANHDDMVQRNALLQQRPDLPVDRLPVHAELVRVQETVRQTSETLEAIKEEMTRLERINMQSSAILETVANELNGGPLPDGWHSWHDLGHLARRQRRKYNVLLQRNKALREMLHASHEANTELAKELQEMAQNRAVSETLEHVFRQERDEAIAKLRNGTLRLNLIVDDTLEPGTMIVGDGRTQLKVTGITPEHIEAVATSRMTEWKAEDIQKRTGMELTGYVLQDEKGDACIVHMGAVRWLSNDELGGVVHPQRAPSHRGMEVVAWMCPDDPDAASAFKWASAEGNAEIVPPCPTCRTARVAVWRDRIAT